VNQTASAQFERFARELRQVEGERFPPGDALDPQQCLECGLIPSVGKHQTHLHCIAELRNRNAVLDMALASVNGATLPGKAEAD
jgi:hypothetical protein